MHQRNVAIAGCGDGVERPVEANEIHLSGAFLTIREVVQHPRAIPPEITFSLVRFEIHHLVLQPTNVAKDAGEPVRHHADEQKHFKEADLPGGNLVAGQRFHHFNKIVKILAEFLNSAQVVERAEPNPPSIPLPNNPKHHEVNGESAKAVKQQHRFNVKPPEIFPLRNRVVC